MEGDEIVIIVRGYRFEVSAISLCEHSDYFLINYLYSDEETHQQEIVLDIVDVTTMALIVQYVKTGINVKDLSNYTLSTVGMLAEAANLFQFTELTGIIESFLKLQEITVKNWIEIMNIAENNNYASLRQLCVEFGVPPLTDMEPQHVSTMKDLLWYLSQTRLVALDEYAVFKFGIDWMLYSKADIDPLVFLLILGCLDVKRVTTRDLIKVKALCATFDSIYNNSLAAGVVNCFIEITNTSLLTIEEIISKESIIIEKYSKEVYCEVMSLVECSKNRNLYYEYTPIVSMSKIETPRSSYDFYDDPLSLKHSDDDILSLPFPEQHYYWDDFDNTEHNLYAFTDTGLEKWLNLKIPKARFNHVYNWCITTWGPRNLVLVISKSNRFSSDFSAGIYSFATIKLYDVQKKKWTEFTAVIPNIIVRKLVVVRDSLFIIGFKDNFIFDLKSNTHKRIAKLPYEGQLDIDTDTRIPLTCAHNDKVYVSNLRSIHTYNETNDEWVKVIDRHISNMVSNDNGFIYVTDVVSNTVCRFKPDVDTTMEVVGKFDDTLNPIINACALGDRLLAFTNKGPGTLSIQKYSINSDAGCDLKEVWCQEGWELKFDPYTPVCCLLLEESSVDRELTKYLKKYIHMWGE